MVDTSIAKLKCLAYVEHSLLFFGVHPLRMTTTSSSLLNFGFTVAEEANVRETLSATKGH